ncbi:DEAD/DEAH box helicase [Dactylosporangium sp. NPDC049525]|uniref:DEAD/DEAH box helicase n=1 Tax=Dactylosporangium sp. NPDC049525 TaxID=3154730 RepID=UPI003430E4F0
MAVRRLIPSSSATFADLGVPAPLVAVLAANGVTEPFPIQTATLPDAIAGRDVLGRGRTGSGKTYAFVLPVLIRLAASRARNPRRPGRPRALVLVPTRELATQVEAAMAPLAQALQLRTQVVFGGVGANPQISALRAGIDVLVACPGRLDDHVRSGHARLDDIEVTVLDEADHMADLGFLPVVRRLLDATPSNAQRLLFSATLDAGVDVLVRRYLTDPVTHSVDPVAAPPVDMTHHVLHLRDEDRFPVLVELTAAPGRTVVFTRTKRGAKTLAKKLVAAGVPAVELHGNLAQNARDRNLTAFSDGSARTLVATDIAARGIHVDDVALVIHADPPAEHKAYLHRSGRTARAGASGTVITLMTDKQTGDVRQLAREAGIKPTITKLRPGDQLLTELAPGKRTFQEPPAEPVAVPRQGRGRARDAFDDGDSQRTAGRRSGRRRGAGTSPESATSTSGRGTSGATDARRSTTGGEARGTGRSDGGARRGQQGDGAARRTADQTGTTRRAADQAGTGRRVADEGDAGGRSRARRPSNQREGQRQPSTATGAGATGGGAAKTGGAAATGRPASAATFSSQARVGRRSGR